MIIHKNLPGFLLDEDAVSVAYQGRVQKIVVPVRKLAHHGKMQ